MHCPPGKTHDISGGFRTRSGTLKADRATVQTNYSISLTNIRPIIPALAAQTSIPISIRVYQGNTNRAFESIGTVTADTPLAPVTRTFTGLQSNVRHAVDLVAGSNVNNVLATTCFRTGETPADMSRPLDYHDDINHGDWASGCFAFADRKGPNHRKKVIACFCGARNSSGDWARTDSADGFTYMLPDARRTELGCTTN